MAKPAQEVLGPGVLRIQTVKFQKMPTNLPCRLAHTIW
jgi:hypothetical protein